MIPSDRLRSAAARIAANRGEQPAGPFKALRKLFVQEKRDWKRPDAPRIFPWWKPGELFEVLNELRHGDRAAALAECRDVAYYGASSFDRVWRIIEKYVPAEIISAAVEKYERRASGERGVK